jgi:hypothetical protein
VALLPVDVGVEQSKSTELKCERDYVMLSIFKTTRIHKLACGVFLAALALATHTATAQMPGPPSAGMNQVPQPPALPKRNVDAEVSQMTKRYGLSTSQAEQIHTILKDQTTKAEAMVSDDSLSPMERITKFKFFKEEEIARVSPILNAEQREKYIKDLQSMSHPQFQPPANFPPPPSGV